MVPALTRPGGKPVTAVPGLTPRSPLITLGPVLVTVVPASTAYDVAVPRPTGAWAATAAPSRVTTRSRAAAVARGGEKMRRGTWTSPSYCRRRNTMEVQMSLVRMTRPYPHFGVASSRSEIGEGPSKV